MTSTRAGIVLQHIRRLGGTARPGQPTDAQLLERFTARRDEVAFAELVRRHGPMVLNVCRSVLHHEQDAEDAFQATFWVLARRAPSIRQPEAVAGWLYEVAYRAAVKAQADAARRRAQERRASPMAPANPALDMTLRDLQRALHEALQRLPDKYRLPLVLCYLEGRSQAEAASQLGWSKGTFRGRLDRGREHLRRRLAARGVALSALLCATAVAPRAAADALVNSIVRAAAPSAVDGTAAGALSARAAALADGVSRSMTASRLKVAMVVLLAVGLVVCAGALAARERPAESQRSEVRGQKSEVGNQGPQRAAEEKGDSVAVSGCVVDPEGKPVAGAKVFFVRYILGERNPPPPTVISDDDGRFRLRVSRTGYQEAHEKNLWLRGAVIALGKDFAPGWVGGDNIEKLANVTIRLRNDVPIEGRVLDLQGQPVAGVSVQVRSVRLRENGGDLKAFVEVLKKQQPYGRYHPGTALSPALLGLTRPVVTGADGKFRLRGISGECLVTLRFAGPTIETAEVDAMTHPTPTIRVPRGEDFQTPYSEHVIHGTVFDHAAAPTRPIEGVVRDRDTGKPLAGVTIQARLGSPKRPRFVGDPTLDTITNAQGRYRLVGLSREAGHRLEAWPGPGQPYLRAGRTAGATGDLRPVTVDFTLKRGVLIRGRVTNKENGRPVAARVEYFAFDDNAYLKEAPGFRDVYQPETRTAEDGSFALLALPGRGLLTAKPSNREEEGHYLMGVGADKVPGQREDGNFITHPHICNAHRYNTLVEVNPARGTESMVRDLVLDPGKTVTGTIVGPDGQPVKGASIDSVFGVWYHVKDLPAAEFRIPGVDPKHPRAFLIRHHDKDLGAAVLFTGDEAMPVTVRLQKCATITGRLVDEDGLPRPSWIAGYIHKGQLNIKGGVGHGMQGTGKDGRFRIEGLIPGLKLGFHAGNNPSFYDQHLIPELMLREGEVRDLGDLKRKATE
jgi:RNA polymerase sigma factor (sigma-70 family)